MTLNNNGYQSRCFVNSSVYSPIFTLAIVEVPTMGDSTRPKLWIGTALLSAMGLAADMNTAVWIGQ